jgi:hypothetical protein
MSVVLLLIGVVTTLAGLLLVAAGVTLHDGPIDAEAITPGTIAAIGGLLLIGMGLAVRELRRIERTLAQRPMPRAPRLADASERAAVEASDASVRIPFPSKSKTQLQAAAPSPGAASQERLRVKLPSLQAREEEEPVVEEHVRELVLPAAATGSAHGGTLGRVMPRLEARVRPAAAPAPAKVSGIGAFLAGGRSRKDGAAAPAQTAVAPPRAAEPAPYVEADIESVADRRDGTATVTALKSGVVEGMAYTLYSDGSIEAQLPQGTLRFGSITALREHIDSGA